MNNLKGLGMKQLIMITCAVALNIWFGGCTPGNNMGGATMTGAVIGALIGELPPVATTNGLVL